jgi:pimeloyl-ACP methyl ester carboxylesterase
VQYLVIDYPDRVSALVLMDTSHASPDGIDPAIVDLAVTVLREHGVETFHRLSKELADPLASQAHQRVLRERPGYEAFSDHKALTASGAMRISMSPRFIGQSDRLGALARVAMPTLVIVGDQDAAFIEHAHRMANAISGARLAIIPDAGHSPQFENPEAWWAVLSSFLEEVAHG